MTFQKAVEGTSDTQGAYRPGLQALTASKHRLVRATRHRDLRGSVDLDTCLATLYPAEPRWDYAIGVKLNSRDDRVAYVEIHPASTNEVNAVLAKHAWLLRWLDSSAPLLNGLPSPSFHWVGTKGCHVSRNSPQWRRLAKSGIRLSSTLDVTQ